MSQDSQLAVTRPLVKASSELSLRLGMEVPALIDAMKSQCFKGKRPDEVTDAQLATYISTANALGLNPLLPGQMYAYPDRAGGGVTVMIGPDGVFTLLSNHTDVVAQKDGGPAFWTEYNAAPEEKNDTCTGFINHRTKGLLKKTIWVQEWIVSTNGNWATRKHHMAEIRALKQVARMIIHGLPVDSDEHKLGEMLNVTESAQDEQQQATAKEDVAPNRPASPARQRKGASAVQDAPKGESKSATMEAEIVPPKTIVPEVEKTVSAPTDEQKAHQIAMELAADKEPDTKRATTAKEQAQARDTIGDKEEIVAVCKVQKVFAFSMKISGTPTPSVQATVSGEFNGDVFDLGGGTLKNDEIVPSSPLWKVGEVVTLSLRGRLNSLSKKVMAVAFKIAPVEATPESQAMEME